MVSGKQVRTIIAATSKKKAAELTGQTLSSFNNYWCVTGNKIEIECGLANVGKVMKASSSMGFDFLAQ